MARVLLSKNVATGHVPTGESFGRVVAETKGRLQDFPGTSSVIQIGSTHRGDSNCVSDLDVVVAYSRLLRRNVTDLLAGLCVYAQNLAVPLEFIPLDLAFAGHGAHSWTPSFTMHVKWAEENGGIICGEAVTARIQPREERKSEGLDYAVSKLQKILKKMTLLQIMDEREQYGLFTEVIQVPMFLARKVIWDMGIKLPFDSKAEVVDAYCLSASHEEVSLFRELVLLAGRYRDFVEERPTKTVYRNRVKEVLGGSGLEKLVRYLEATIENSIIRMG